MNRPFDEAKYNRLLDGLEVVELKLSEVESGIRIDAEMYQKHFVEAEALIRQKGFCTLEDATDSVKKGIFDINSDCYTDSGVPFVRISNLKNMVTDESDVIFIPESEHQKNIDTALRKNDVILSKTAYPAASLVTFSECNASQDTVAIRLRQNSKINSHYLVTFLNTKYGLALMRRWFTGNIQMHLNLTDCKSLPLPILSFDFQGQIKNIFEASISKTSQSKALYAEAENLLLAELGLHDWQPSQEQIAVKSFKESFLNTGRLDAEYYQAKYQTMMALLGRSGKRICDVASLAKDRFDPSRVDSFEYIEIGNLSGDGSTKSETLSAAGAPSRAQWIVQTGDVITSTVRPIRRLSALVEKEQRGFVCSSGFAVLRPTNIAAELLLVFLRAPIICEILDLHTTASMYPAISTDDLMAIPIPEFSGHLAVAVIEKITQSRTAKQESKHLLDLAKRGVEMAIEQDEATAMQWMEAQWQN